MATLFVLIRQRVRRDRWQLLIWLGGVALLAWSAQIGVSQSYGTAHDREVLLQTVVAHPVILLFRGLPSGPDNAALMLFLILPWLLMLAAFALLFLAVRHTRGDEEEGRAELLGATKAARRAPLTATLLYGLGVSLLFGLVVVAVYVGLGLGLRGSLAAGAAVALLGAVFLAIGLLVAQLVRAARTANSLGVWVLLVSFVMAGVGNAIGSPSADLTRVESAWLNWISPFGLAEQTRPFADNLWWPLLPGLLAVAMTVAVAYVLHGMRDIDGSLIAERGGRSKAPNTLRSAFALQLRLARGSMIAWASGGFVTGVLATGLASVVKQMGDQVPAVKTILDALAGGEAMDRGMVVIFFLVVGVLAACFGVQTINRARQEETRGTAELLRTTPVGRARWVGGFVAVGAIGMLGVLLASIAGAALGTLAGGSTDSGVLLRDASLAGAGQLLAAAVVLGISALVLVVLPRWTVPLGWVLVTLALSLGLFGPLFGAPEWAIHLSPFAYAPVPTADGMDPRSLWGLLAALAVSAGLTAILSRHRELHPEG